MDCLFCVAFKTDALLEKSDFSLPLDILLVVFLEWAFEDFLETFLDTEFELFFNVAYDLSADLCSNF